jgi:Zn-dependent protease
MSQLPTPPEYSDVQPGADYKITPEGTVQRQGALRRRSALGGVIVSVLYVLSKLKFVLVFVKTGGITLVSLLISLGGYALLYPWQFAAGLVGMIFVHEMGHYAVARQQGIKTGVPVFIPFVGAFIGLKQQPHDARQEAIIAIAGPVVGSAAAFATLVVGQAQGGTPAGHLLLALAQLGFIINLFNLIPVSPLDGGRVLSLLSKYFSLVGLLILVALLVLVNFNPLLMLIIAVGGWSTWQRFRGHAESAAYYAVPARDKAIIGLIYFALLAGLGLALVTPGMHPKPFVNLS